MLAGEFTSEGLDYIPHFVCWPEFVDAMRERVSQGLPLEKYRDMAKWPLLCLDDIGAERDTTGFASEKLNGLLTQRVGRWTILTSNLNLEQIAQIEPRIASRIVREAGNLFVELDTMDYGLRNGCCGWRKG